MLRKNPVKAQREMLGLTVNQLSNAAHLHRSVILRTEQGLYATIPPRLHSYLVGRLGESDPSLTFDYRRWVGEKRADSFGRLNRELPRFNFTKHPFVEWRHASEITERLELCKLFCLHPSTITRFENSHAQSALPDQLVEALSDSGYGGEIIGELGIRYKLYRAIKIAERTQDQDRISSAMRMAEEHRRMIAA